MSELGENIEENCWWLGTIGIVAIGKAAEAVKIRGKMWRRTGQVSTV